MNITKNTFFCYLLVLISLALCRCGKKADENKPIGEVKAEAEKMSVEKLRSIATTYKKAITAKKDDVEELAFRLKNIPLTKMMSDEAKDLKADIDALNKSISSLHQRFDIYYEKLKEKGVDISGLEIQG